jgi:hypothetical protein
MPVNRFDQASRYIAKLDPLGFLRWLLARLSLAISFHGWLDTRSLPFPGEKDRVCDTVACLLEPGPPAVWWALPVEFQLKPDGTMFGRFLEYLGRLWREQRPPGGRGRFHVGGALVNLTGKKRTASKDMRLGETGVRTGLWVEERNLATEDAAATLAGIAAGTIPRCILPFIPLMHGGGEDGNIKEWVRLASRERNRRLRGDYGGLVLVFAELAGRLDQWEKALEGWDVIESKKVLEWQKESAARAHRNDLLGLLEERFGRLPRALVQRINQTDDVERLHAAVLQVLRLRKLEELQL